MIVFRADGNASVGLGHVMRCLSIANAFKQTGMQCLFITANNELQRIITGCGHENLVLDSEYNKMDDELRLFKDEVEKRKVEAIFVDSYFVTDRYLRELHAFCENKQILLTYIDDVLAFHYSCDVLINYNIYADLSDYRNLYHNCCEPEFLLNTSYAPIRAEFQNLPDRAVDESADCVLISTGGADSEHIGYEIAKSIARHKEWDDISFHFVVGVMNLDKDRICALAKEAENIIIHCNVKKMSELMQSCDVAVTAAGSTMYELCATQTPSITYVLADNQIPGAAGFEQAGVLCSAGDIREFGASVLADRLLNDAMRLLGDFNRRKQIALKMKAVVDGQGAARIVQRVVEICATKYKEEI